MSAQDIIQPTQDYKVVIKCFTYNQERFIEDTLKGFVKQKANFPFCVLVVDDCSTDGTASIIRRYEEEYPDIIKGIYLQENYYSQKKKKYPLLEPWFKRSEYVAFCEGDDYWTDDLKLQKQVDILDADKNVGFTYSAFSVVNENNQELNLAWCEERMQRSHSGDLFASLMHHNYILTLTVCLRSDIYRKSVDYCQKSKVSIDYFQYLLFAGFSEGAYIPEKMGAYRINPNGIVQSDRKNGVRLCAISAVKASEIFLKGDFKKRSFVEDKTISASIIAKWRRLYKDGYVTKSEFKGLFLENPRLFFCIPLAALQIAREKLC